MLKWNLQMKTGEENNIPSGWYDEMIMWLKKKIKSNLNVKARMHH